MTRVKGGTVARARRKKVLDEAKGYFGSKHRLFKTAQEQLFHSGVYAFRDRRQNKRNFRKLWITRINAACRLNNISYSRFINGLSKAEIDINRKMLSEIAIDSPSAFADLVKIANDALNETTSDSKKSVTKVSSLENMVDLSGMTVAELKEMAKAQHIEGYTTMKKAELIETLK